MNGSLSPFPCTSCGLCCQKVEQSIQTAWLSRGDGICRYYEEATKLCSIYKNRPLVCRVEDYYRVHLSTQMTWQNFVQINIAVCKKFQSE